MENRELKFRAWDTINKKWLFGYDYPNLGGFNLIGEVTLMGELNSVSLERWNDIAIMQYTGLKDKNGKDIYEGDIDIKLGRVIFWNGSYWFQKTSGKYSSISIYCEIIGNIYENPELL